MNLLPLDATKSLLGSSSMKRTRHHGSKFCLGFMGDDMVIEIHCRFKAFKSPCPKYEGPKL